jgi:hypothetical protein
MACIRSGAEYVVLRHDPTVEAKRLQFCLRFVPGMRARCGRGLIDVTSGPPRPSARTALEPVGVDASALSIASARRGAGSFNLRAWTVALSSGDQGRRGADGLPVWTTWSKG